MADGNGFELVSEVLEKMIDSQISNTEALTSLKSTVDKLNSATSDIRSHFTNGFRSEIKDHVAEQINGAIQQFVKIHEDQKATDDNIYELIKELSEEVKSFKKLGFWVKAMGGLVAAIAAISIAIAKISSQIGG